MQREDADNHPELDKTKDADADAFESLDLRRRFHALLMGWAGSDVI